MYVKDYMTKEPITITKDVVVSKAIDIMAKGNFHRLPIVNSEGKLVGLVTSGTVAENSGAKNTSLSVFELNYLLSKTTVEDIMIKDVKTVSAEAYLEEAAEAMMQNNIGVLPVVSDDNKVIGIITEKDVFKALMELLSYKQKGTKFVIPCKDVPGEFAQITQLFGDNDANLQSAAVYHTERGTEAVIKATGEISVEDMMKVLKDAGFELKDVIQTTEDGEVIKFN